LPHRQGLNHSTYTRENNGKTVSIADKAMVHGRTTGWFNIAYKLVNSKHQTVKPNWCLTPYNHKKKSSSLRANPVKIGDAKPWI
jgi:hypothetical protein